MGAYNCEHTLAECINSIINQTFKDWEFIICDDCSTDNTYSVLMDYAKKDSRIVVIRNKQNSKLAQSLNNCLRIAKGEYIARMDADDEALPNRLLKEISFLENHDEYAVVGTCAYINNGSETSKIRFVPEYPNSNEMLISPTFLHPTIMMRKTVYDNLGGYTVSRRTVRGQDKDLWFRFYASGYKGYNIQEPLLIYHYSLEDMKKQSIKCAFYSVLTALIGYRLLKVPFYKYPLAFKPFLSYFVPNKLLMYYHERR